MNKVILIGNLTAEPELKETTSGKKVCHFSVAVSEGFGDNKVTNYFRINVWNKQGENCADYLTKGSKVGIVGRLENRSYEKDGKKNTITEISAIEVEFLSAKSEKANKPEEMEEVAEEDFPF